MDDHGSSFEVFLVEDVILTLGNLRGLLSRLVADGTLPRGGGISAEIDRLDRQLALLDVRARALLMGRDRRGARRDPGEPPANLFADRPGPACLTPPAPKAMAVFRSRRTAGRDAAAPRAAARIG